jgi:hypothetical protein
MKRSLRERRVKALELAKQSQFKFSRAHRLGSLTEEEWQRRKDAEISHLEELINGRKTS